MYTMRPVTNSPNMAKPVMTFRSLSTTVLPRRLIACLGYQKELVLMYLDDNTLRTTIGLRFRPIGS